MFNSIITPPQVHLPLWQIDTVCVCLCVSEVSSVIVKHLSLDVVSASALVSQCQDAVIDSCHLDRQTDGVLVLARYQALLLKQVRKIRTSGREGGREERQ